MREIGEKLLPYLPHLPHLPHLHSWQKKQLVQEGRSKEAEGRREESFYSKLLNLFLSGELFLPRCTSYDQTLHEGRTRSLLKWEKNHQPFLGKAVKRG
jgi:hypothetical protein